MEYRIDVRNARKRIVPGTLKLGGSSPNRERIGFTNYYMERDGEPYFGICGEFHFSRYPEKDWGTELGKMKSSGIDIIATYIFWNHHEETEGNLRWEGNLNLRRYAALCGQLGLDLILRPGPFCHGEARNGGLPDWLFGRAFDIRSNDEAYLAYVRAWYGAVGREVRGLLHKDGGPIIGVQLENEYMHAAAIWELTAKQGDEYFTAGSGGAEHMRQLKQIALEAGLEVPIYTSTGWGGAPVLEDEVLPLYGGYAYTPWSVSKERPRQKPTREYVFADYHDDNAESPGFEPPYAKSKYPFACCEMGGGMQTWYLSRFAVDPESVLAMSLVKIAGGCNFIGYYMFHGGTNPVGQTGYMNESTTPKITYDFQAPIGEFGQVRASNHLLRPLHYFLRRFGKRLAPMATVLPPDPAADPLQTETLRYAARAEGRSGFLFVNNYQDHVEMRTHKGVRFAVKREGETLSFPRRGGLTVAKNAAAVLPFGFDLDGVMLHYATAQPVTKLAAPPSIPAEGQCGEDVSSSSGGDRIAFLFYMPPGMDGELCFDQRAIEELTLQNAEMEAEDDRCYIYVAKERSAVIRLRLAGGGERIVYVMTAEEAGKLWEVELRGERRIFFSEAALIADEEGLEAISFGREQVELQEFSPWQASGDIVTHRSAQVPHRDIPLGVRRLRDDKVLLEPDWSALDAVEDVLLSIDYDGNVGYAFANGILFHDHFWNGQPWEIGLSRFRDKAEAAELVVQVTPRREGAVSISDEAAMAIKLIDSGKKSAEIRSVTAVPVYRIRVDGL